MPPITDRDNGYAKRVRAILQAGAGATTTYVGVFGQKAAGQHADTGITVGEIADIHEFGLGVPERSFLRAWFDQDRDKILEALRAAHRQVLLGKLTPERAGAILGMRFAGEVQKFISDRRVQPPLHPLTIAKKESSTPLIDTGALRSAISWYVETRIRAATP